MKNEIILSVNELSDILQGFILEKPVEIEVGKEKKIKIDTVIKIRKEKIK